MKYLILIAVLFGDLTMKSIATAETISVPIKRLPLTLDPQHYEDIYSMVVILQVHRGLLRFLPNLEIAPDIAESYKVLEQGKKITFVLGERYFSDGTRIEAKHVVRTFQRLFKGNGGFAADLNYIKGAKRILHGEKDLSVLGVREVNKRTVEFFLEKPVAIFFSHLATVDMAILPLKKDLSFNWKKDPGAGPYKVSEVGEKTLKLVMRKEMLKPQMPEVVKITQMSDSEAQSAALAGQIDSLDGYAISKENLKALKLKGWKESVTTLTRQIFLSINPSKVDSPSRRLIKDALHQIELDFKSPSYVRAWGLVPVGLSGSLTKSPQKREGLKPLPEKKTFKLFILNAEPMIPVIAAQIKAALVKCKVDLSIHEISMDEYLKKIKNYDFDLLFRSKFLDYPDGISILTYFRSNYSSNTFFVRDPKVDSLLDIAMGELDLKKRIVLYEDIQKKILSHNTVVPLVFGSDNQGMWSEKVEHVPGHPLGIQGLPFETLKLRRQK